MWKYWAKALGAKEFSEDGKADKVAIIRTFIIVFELIVGVVIILNAIASHGLNLIGL